ncbi:hypothetical protein Dimus_032654 [Dionaea muscipula]
MENKQLNFSAPLISARRYSSPQRSYYIEHDSKNDTFLEEISTLCADQHKLEDLSLDQFVKPGSVAFCWEQSPGKAKGGSPGPPSTTAPKPPPGMMALDTSTNKLSDSGEIQKKVLRSPQNKLSGVLKVLRSPPQTKPSGAGGEPLVVCPRSSPNKLASGRDQLSSPHICSLSRWEAGPKAAGMRRKRNNTSSRHDQAENAAAAAAYSDAVVLDMESRLESSSISCSTISGLGESKHSETLFVDAQYSRDLIMNRFLPAATAMALELPQQQHTSPRGEARALVPTVVLKEYRASTPQTDDSTLIVPYRARLDLDKEESEAEDINCDLPGRVSIRIRACGFFHWVDRYKKSSFRFLNPVPAMKVGTKAALSSASKISRLVKLIPQKSPAGPGLTPTTKKNKTNSGVNTSALHNIIGDGKQNGKYSRPMFYSGELQSRSVSVSPYRNSTRQHSLSPCRNYVSPPFHSGGSVAVVPKNNDYKTKLHDDDRTCKKSEELASWERSSIGYDCSIPVVEKTVYVDSESTLQRVSQSNFNVPKTNRPVGKPKSKSSLHGGGISRPPISEVADGRLRPPSPDGTRRSDTSGSGTMEMLITCRKSAHPSGLLKERTDGRLPLTPPLPKSPSDSWLSRNLNSGSPRNSVVSPSHLRNNKVQVQPKKQNAATMPASASAAKWEKAISEVILSHST